MPGSLPGVTPLARDALRMKPTKRLYVDLVRILYSLSALTCAHAGRPTRGSSTTRARIQLIRRWTTGAARRSPRRRREARALRWGAILLGPVKALGLVTLLRLTTGRGRPPSGHRYCSNSFLRKVLDADGEDGGEQECDERRPRGWRAVTGTRSVGEVVGLSGARDGVLRDGVQQPARWSIREAKRRLGHVEREDGITVAGSIYPYVDPRILVDIVHEWNFSRQQFQQIRRLIRTFSKHAGWLSDSEEEAEEEDYY